jgi:hypothetical protein
MYNTAAYITVNMQQVRSRYWDIENKVELKPNKSYKVHTTQSWFSYIIFYFVYTKGYIAVFAHFLTLIELKLFDGFLCTSL